MIKQFPESDSADALRKQLDRARDELREAETERAAAKDLEVLLRGELQHRVRNMLASIRSMFSRTVAAGGTIEEMADHFRGRLDAVGRCQSAQAGEPGRLVNLEQIVRDELQNFQFGEDPAIGIAGPEVGLDNRLAFPMSLAIHELATNSIKFGVLSTPTQRGHLDISWDLLDGWLRFEWSERGVPILASAPLKRGFGREFLEQALPYQVQAETIFELKPGGVFCSIAVPL